MYLMVLSEMFKVWDLFNNQTLTDIFPGQTEEIVLPHTMWLFSSTRGVNVNIKG